MIDTIKKVPYLQIIYKKQLQIIYKKYLMKMSKHRNLFFFKLHIPILKTMPLFIQFHFAFDHTKHKTDFFSCSFNSFFIIAINLLWYYALSKLLLFNTPERIFLF